MAYCRLKKAYPNPLQKKEEKKDQKKTLDNLRECAIVKIQAIHPPSPPPSTLQQFTQFAGNLPTSIYCNAKYDAQRVANTTAGNNVSYI